MQFPETLLMKCSTPKEGLDNLGPKFCRLCGFLHFFFFFFCSREHFLVDWPCTTTWLLGTRICWPSGVCAYWRTVVLCWAPVVTVCRPWRPSDPGVASWIVPLAEIVTKMRKTKHSISIINDIVNNAIMTPVITKCKTYIGHSLCYKQCWEVIFY